MEVTSRRAFLRWAGAAAAGGLCPGLLRAAGEAVGQPRMNVLFIASDDLKPELGCYGRPLAKTPNIDRLAASGTLFERAYCSQAVCSPSRNGVLTGLRPETLQIYDLPTFFRTKVPDAVTLPQLFKQAGYQAQSLGKIFHVGNGNHDDPASWSVPSWHPRGGGYADPETRAAERKRYQEAQAQGLTPQQLTSQPKGPATECADVPDNAYGDGMITDEAIRRLGELRDQPFFLGVGFLKPHLPFCAPKRYWDLYRREDFHLPAFRTLPKDAPAIAGHNSEELRSYSDIPDLGPISDERGLELLHGYHAAVSFVDAQVGKVLGELTRLGLDRNTIVVLFGDHGWHLGDHGLWCKHTNYEQAAHAPLIIRVPGQRPGRTRALVEFVDLYPTLAGLCGLTPPARLAGTSFAPLLDQPERPWKRAAFHVYPHGNRTDGRMMGRSVRTDRYRLVEWSAPGKESQLELYDYQQDPDETVNLAADPAQAQALKAHLDLLHAGWTAALPG